MAIEVASMAVEVVERSESALGTFDVQTLLRFVLVNVVSFLVAWLRVRPQLQQRRAQQLRQEQEAAAEAAAKELLGLGAPLARAGPKAGQRLGQPGQQRPRRQAPKRLGAAAKKALHTGDPQVDCSDRGQIEGAVPVMQPSLPVARSMDREEPVPAVPDLEAGAQLCPGVPEAEADLVPRAGHPSNLEEDCAEPSRDAAAVAAPPGLSLSDAETGSLGHVTHAAAQGHAFQQTITLPNWDAFEDESDDPDSSEPDVPIEELPPGDGDLAVVCAAGRGADDESECALSGSDSDVDGSRRPHSKVGSCASTQSFVDDDERLWSSDDETVVGHAWTPSMFPPGLGDEECRIFSAATLLSRRPATLHHARPACLEKLRLREVHGLQPDTRRPWHRARANAWAVRASTWVGAVTKGPPSEEDFPR